ncbi:DOPA 4,5-dioxygenase family protein (plasmid) [Burkholderia gladioli]|uniref:DOPA 4,5-dioxygenase family protein n=1 Tax=Burkholderia gladioli TaxID=28095 RepID=UPI001934FCDA|nr:DOPA 4,5-dioxygenase family protein [Burkholderia gladioli]QPQ89097.1 DOPA 4,5-dioxygenase family protein [Burkholderia gladioli]
MNKNSEFDQESDSSLQRISQIQSYHAHIYFDGTEEHQAALLLRSEIADRFYVTLGRVHERAIGPHARPMYQVSFAPDQFNRFVPWLMMNRKGLAVLIHPNTGRPKRDHLSDAMWMGEILPINSDPLVDVELDPEPPMISNTLPTIAP